MDTFFQDAKDRQPLTDTDAVVIRAASELHDPLHQKALDLKTNVCPVCLAIGRFYPDESTDGFVATLEVLTQIYTEESLTRDTYTSSG